jgi:hypothetical protein
MLSMSTDGPSVDELNERVQRLEQTVMLLADFSVMTTLWLFRLTSDEITSLTRQWFTQQSERIVQPWPDSQNLRDHLLRFSRLIDEMDSLPQSSPVRQKIWSDFIQKIRREIDSN